MRKNIIRIIIGTLSVLILSPMMVISNPLTISLDEVQKGEVLIQQYAQASLVGIWRAQIQSLYGYCQWEIILKGNGRFSKTFRCPNNLMTYELGDYFIGQGFIRLLYTSHRPTEYKGRRLHYPETETIFFQFVDRNHIFCEDRILGGKWHAYRVQ